MRRDRREFLKELIQLEKQESGKDPVVKKRKTELEEKLSKLQSDMNFGREEDETTLKDPL